MHLQIIGGKVLSASNELVIKTGSNGITIKSNGDAAISENLDVGVGASVTSIKA